ncbi:MAG: acyl-ACP--UDP-N-acetylglucosamine O-acyltransferase [Nitrospinota bacterium]|nr:MAG: acyl-ACP--UDP-N-acetylglucosamine O-acyltransferase [Nitrospinota bacterium]
MTEIHPSAVVHPGAELGERVSIGPFAVIGAHVRLGEGTSVGPHAVIEGWTEVGRDCQISPGVVIGAPPQDLKYKGFRSFVRIGDRNIIREYVTIHRSTQEEGATIIGHDNFLMAYTHIAHDCRIGNHVVIVNYTGLSGHVEVEDRAFISGHIAIHQFVRIGFLAMISGGSRVGKDVPPFMLAEGNPMQIRGLNTVGMQRNQIPAPVRLQLKQAFKLLYRSNLNTSQALQRIKAEIPMSAEVQRLVTFIENSSRGIYR